MRKGGGFAGGGAVAADSEASADGGVAGRVYVVFSPAVQA